MSGVIGGGLILAVCVILGFAAGGMAKLRVRQLEAFCGLVGHIRSEIGYSARPLESIFNAYSDETLDECGFLSAARTGGAVTAMTFARARLCLTEEEIDGLERFFGSLGRHNLDEELVCCEKFQKQLAESSGKAREALPGRLRLCRTLGILFGVLAAILML